MDGHEAGEDGESVSRTVWGCPVCAAEQREDGCSTEERYCDSDRHKGVRVLMLRVTFRFGFSSPAES